jgi:2-(1,2-epoxy-1,2-dihydrophenyl)acetyl-CoA isomerase
MFNTLLYDVKDGVATITLNRPDVYNACNNELTFELQDAIKNTAKDDSVRVVVLTGAGKAFCSGQDLKDAAAQGVRSFMDSVFKRYNPIIRGLRNLPKPVICKLNGVAAGAGCSLALACDIIIASQTASLTEAFVSIGLVTDSGSSYFLPRLIGYSKAFEMATMPRKIPAQEAFEMGLVNKVVAPEQLDAAIKEATDYYANAPTKAIGLMKKMLNKSFNSDLETILEMEAYSQEIAGNTKDHKEGVIAFIEKRKPVFKGE